MRRDTDLERLPLSAEIGPSGSKPREPGTGTALVLSGAALVLVVATNAVWREASASTLVALWSPVLLLPLLLSYTYGWRGVLIGIAGGVLTVLGVALWRAPGQSAGVEWDLVGAFSFLLSVEGVAAGWYVSSLRRRAGEAVRLAFVDALTGLPNRRVLDLFLAKHFARARRRHPLSVVLFGLDRLQVVNERHGRSAGDDHLRRFGRLIAANAREMDVAGRLDSDRFLIVLPGEEEEGAMACAERFRRLAFEGTGEGFRPISVSCGIASFRSGMGAPEDLLKTADEALQMAKERGGNVVAVAAAPTGREESVARVPSPSPAHPGA